MFLDEHNCRCTLVMLNNYMVHTYRSYQIVYSDFTAPLVEHVSTCPAIRGS